MFLKDLSFAQGQLLLREPFQRGARSRLICISGVVGSSGHSASNAKLRKAA